jgi:hypothetical protein
MLEVISRNYEIENYFWRFVKICGNSDCFWKFVNICGNSDCKAAHREEKKQTYISICQPQLKERETQVKEVTESVQEMYEV